MAQKLISERAIGKHIGHACEGHLRGILSHVQGISTELLVRQLPFRFPVNPDSVVLSDTGKIRAVFIVAFWANADNSHMKFYRTRMEYQELLRAKYEHPEWFTDESVVATVIYGAPEGWKARILEDMAEQCSPFVFLPSVLSADISTQIVQRAFDIYKSAWESGRSNVREVVENYIANATLDPNEEMLLQILSGLLPGSNRSDTWRTTGTKGEPGNLSTQNNQKPTARIIRNPTSETIYSTRNTENMIVPSRSFKTRLRQGLGLLSLFSLGEIAAWLTSRPQMEDVNSQDFARRAFFLDLGTFSERRRLVGSTVVFQLRRPYRTVGNTEVYAPDLLDFEDWTRLDIALIDRLLSIHQLKTTNPTSVFVGGAYDQIAGNWHDICARVSDIAPRIVTALKLDFQEDFVDALCNEKPVTAPVWHPAYGMAWHYPNWAFTASALAIAENRREIRSTYDARRQNAPSIAEASNLYEQCRGRQDIVVLLEEIIDFCGILRQTEMLALSNVIRPRLLSLDEPCSWVADFYNTLTTNSSHNPLNGVVHLWLINRYPDLVWHGWPDNRSRSLQQVDSSIPGRRQWQFIGIARKAKQFVAAEVKSITQNNWGNKSKELYDRVSEARTAATSIGWQCHTICVIDGDLGAEQIAELRTGIGHDEIVGIDDLIEWYSQEDL